MTKLIKCGCISLRAVPLKSPGTRWQGNTMLYLVPFNTMTAGSQAQDTLFGAGNRLHNFAKKAFSGLGGWRCTVCNDLKPLKALD